MSASTSTSAARRPRAESCRPSRKTLFGRPFKGDKEIETNLKITNSFRKALVKEYGERVTQWAFPSSSYDDRMLKAKPLSGYRIQQIIARAQEAKAKDDTALARLVSERRHSCSRNP